MAPQGADVRDSLPTFVYTRRNLQALFRNSPVSTAISSATLDPRRRKMLFRAWHRGMKEMDILMGKFADAKLAVLSDEDLDAFEFLMDAPDPDLFKWLTDAVPLPPEYDTALFAQLKGFHEHAGPIHV